MSKDNSEKSISRRSALMTAGGLGAGALAIPGAASASKESEYELTVYEGGAETYRYIGDNVNATPQLTTDADFSYTITCVSVPLAGEYCLEARANVNSDGTVTAELIAAGTQIAGATLNPLNPSLSVSFDVGVASGQASLSVDFDTFTISGSGEICAVGYCASDSFSVSL